MMLDYPLRECTDRANTIYQKALRRAGAWPLYTNLQGRSMVSILDGLKGFSPQGRRPRCVHGACNQTFRSMVLAGVKKTENEFDGLCLGKLGYLGLVASLRLT